MRDPYLYDDVDVLRNNLDIKDNDILRSFEADATNLSMSSIYSMEYDKFDIDTLLDIHYIIFKHVYDWAGQFRTIQIIKNEDVLGGDTVHYAYPKEIKKQLQASMKELVKLKRGKLDDHEIVFRLVRIIAQIWQTHPFREGNTRSVIVFSVLFAKHLGFDVDHEIFKENSSYVRNSLVWASQGIYSKYEYLERIFFDAILHETYLSEKLNKTNDKKYEKIGDYSIKDYKEKPHTYIEK